ncbi:hypothetical protein Bpfe_008241, partial [Biomphalaria pfeifferi]
RDDLERPLTTLDLWTVSRDDLERPLTTLDLWTLRVETTWRDLSLHLTSGL